MYSSVYGLKWADFCWWIYRQTLTQWYTNRNELLNLLTRWLHMATDCSREFFSTSWQIIKNRCVRCVNIELIIITSVCIQWVVPHTVLVAVGIPIVSRYFNYTFSSFSFSYTFSSLFSLYNEHFIIIKIFSKYTEERWVRERTLNECLP